MDRKSQYSESFETIYSAQSNFRKKIKFLLYFDENFEKQATFFLQTEFTSKQKERIIKIIIEKKQKIKEILLKENQHNKRKKNGRHTLEMLLWKEIIKARDNNKCVNCGDDKKLQVHHIYSFHKYLNVKSNLDNGVTFCQKCHSEFHIKNNNENNYKQLLDFLENK